MNKINIAFIIDTIETNTAGTEKQLLMLLNSLDREMFNPYLICLRDSEWLKKQDFSFPVIKYNLGSLLSFQFITCLFKFRRLHRDINFDIVHNFFVDANIFGTIAAWFAGCKIIISGRRNMGHWQNKTHLFILRILKKITTQFLSNSKAVARYSIETEKIPSEKMNVIYNGLELDDFENSNSNQREQIRKKWNVSENEILIGVVANLRKVKNIESLIRVAKVLVLENHPVKFVVIGEGEDRERLQDLISEFKLTDKFQLAGQIDNVIDYLYAFDIGVLCSTHESLSNSLIEYMAAGLPIVASDVGGNGETIENNISGILYQSDSDLQFGDALRRLVIDRDYALKLGQKATESAFNRFDSRKFIKISENYYVELYNNVLNEN